MCFQVTPINRLLGFQDQIMVRFPRKRPNVGGAVVNDSDKKLLGESVNMNPAGRCFERRGERRPSPPRCTLSRIAQLRGVLSWCERGSLRGLAAHPLQIGRGRVTATLRSTSRPPPGPCRHCQCAPNKTRLNADGSSAKGGIKSLQGEKGKTALPV